MKKGFTLIELMIVVAIIAIIAAIAIPSLLRARMATNATAAAAAMKALIEAQEIFRRTDYDKDGRLEYSMRMGGSDALNSLHSATVVGDIALVDRAFADAEVLPGGDETAATPKAGYVFGVLTRHTPLGGAATPWLDTANAELTLGHGGSAVPAQYDSTGRDSFMISSAGTIYQKDLGVGANLMPGFDLDTLWIPAE